MSLEALIDKTASRLQILIVFLAVPGVLLLGAGLATGAMAFAGGGMAFLFGGGVAWWRVRQQKVELHALLKDPSRVAQIVPIVQRVQGGIVTNYPVVIVTTDGRPYRVATWAKSVEEAVAPFLARFPHASGPTGDSVFAPDDGFGARLKLIGLMLGSLVVGGLFALLFVTPSVNASMARYDRAYDLQVSKNEALTKALKAVSGAEVQGRWADCSLDSLGDSVVVRLSGAREGGSSPERSGFLLPRQALTLSQAYPLVVYRRDRLDETLNALMGQGRYRIEKPLEEQEVAIVGERRGDQLALRLVDLPAGKVRCEGMTLVGESEKGSSYKEDEALAAAVMRPFCELLSCSNLGPAPEAPVAEKPVEAKVPERKTAPIATGKTLTPDAIRAAVGAASARTRACYEKALIKQRTLQGTLTVAFTVGKDGRVSSAKGSGFPNQSVTDCVVKVFQGLRFPPPADGKATPVKYPIVFRPG